MTFWCGWRVHRMQETLARDLNVHTLMWDEWKYGYLSKLKLHFIHAGKADTRESSFRLALHRQNVGGLVHNNCRTIMCIIPTSCAMATASYAHFSVFLLFSLLCLYRPLLRITTVITIVETTLISMRTLTFRGATLSSFFLLFYDLHVSFRVLR